VTDLIIRPCENDDVNAVIGLWRASGLVVPWNDPAADIAFCRAAPESELFVGLAARAAARPLVATVMTGHDGHRGWLYYLAVDSDWRRRGLGRRMVARAEAWLAELGVAKVQLMIRGDNAAVRGFYDRLGYAEEDRIIMSRRLAENPSRR